jgi:arginine exporter protein ArgO
MRMSTIFYFSFIFFLKRKKKKEKRKKKKECVVEMREQKCFCFLNPNVIIGSENLLGEKKIALDLKSGKEFRSTAQNQTN